MTLILAALLAFPVPPLLPTLGTTPRPVATGTQTTLPATGYATYYNPGIFEQVLATRGLDADGCGDCVGYAALLWPGDMGRVICINGLRLWVVDVAAAHHRAGLIEQGWLIDIDRVTWQALGLPDMPTVVDVTEC